MSYRDEPTATRTACRDCGASLAADAAFCPECGAAQRTPVPGTPARVMPASESPAWSTSPRRRRWWIPVAIGGGAIAALLGGALLSVALMGDGTDGVGAGSPTASASDSATSASPDASASPSSATSPSAAPSPATATIIPNLGIAEVVTDGLNLRAEASDSSETLVTLEQGRRVFIIGAPTDAGDLRWYRIAPFDDIEGCESGCGLIGYVATPTSKAEDPWLEETAVTCPPSPMTDEQIAALTALEALHCYGNSEISLTGTVDLPLHGPMNPYRYTPEWLHYEHLEFLQDAWWISYRPHPDAGLETPTRGDVVRVTGHFEDPAATDCRVTVDPAFFGGEIPGDFESTISPARVVLDCRAAFVWTDYEVIGSEDLGPCCGGPAP